MRTNSLSSFTSLDMYFHLNESSHQVLQESNYIQKKGYQPLFHMYHQYTLLIANLGKDSVTEILLHSPEVQVNHGLEKKINAVVFPMGNWNSHEVEIVAFWLCFILSHRMKKLHHLIFQKSIWTTQSSCWTTTEVTVPWFDSNVCGSTNSFIFALCTNQFRDFQWSAFPPGTIQLRT